VTERKGKNVKKDIEVGQKKEVDMKIPLILSFILMIIAMMTGLGEDKFRYWGVEEKILGTGKFSVFGVLSYHLSILVMLGVFIRFAHNRSVHWFSLIIVFGILNFYAYNSGSCLTDEGVYKRELGATQFYAFEEMETVEVKKQENQGIHKAYVVKVSFKNGEKFTFEQGNEELQMFLEIKESMLIVKNSSY
jgi:hypothetical protein